MQEINMYFLHNVLKTLLLEHKQAVFAEKNYIWSTLYHEKINPRFVVGDFDCVVWQKNKGHQCG